MNMIYFYNEKRNINEIKLKATHAYEIVPIEFVVTLEERNLLFWCQLAPEC